MSAQRRLLIFTGDGKGKSTAALGMVLRAAGHGQRVLVIEFIKADTRTGELAACRHLPNVEIRQMGRGFVPRKDHPKFAEHQAAANEALQASGEAVVSGKFDLIVLDELCSAVSLGLVAESDVLAILRTVPPALHLVLTGRNATPGLIDQADTVSEMKCLKHGYDHGIKAEEGVEF